VAHGTLALAAGTDTSGLSSPVSGIGTATLTFTGLESSVDTVLAGLQYTPTAEFEGTDPLTFSATVTDTASGLPTSTAMASTSVTIDVNPVADAATLTAPTTAVIVHENDPAALVNSLQNALHASTALTVSLPTLDLDDTVTVTLTVVDGTL